LIQHFSKRFHQHFVLKLRQHFLKNNFFRKKFFNIMLLPSSSSSRVVAVADRPAIAARGRDRAGGCPPSCLPGTRGDGERPTGEGFFLFSNPF
jgi:hypothetical protein